MNQCNTCRFWHRQTITGEWWDRPGWGECHLFGDDASNDKSRPAVVNKPEGLIAVCPFAGADGACVDTHETFGCVQHEPATWQPIDTAPKDGETAVLLYVRRLGHVIAGWREDRGGWITLWNHELLNYSPTHWMPLPDPPSPS